MTRWRIRIIGGVTLIDLAIATSSGAAGSRVCHVRSTDGTLLSVECAGSGPELLIVHGGAGDRSRWTPMFPYLQGDFTVCAMDRRAHGQSGDTPPYSLRKEAEDIVAVVESRGRPVAVLGHSYGGVAAWLRRLPHASHLQADALRTSASGRRSFRGDG